MQPAATNYKSKSEHQNKAGTFPHKLFKFLRDVELYNASHVASWAPDGRSFQIHIPSEFISMAEPRNARLPILRWFSYNQYSSFQRQLNIYGFHPVRDGTKKNCYYHEHFRRDCDHLLHRIHRIPGKKGKKIHLLANATGSELDSSSQIISSRTSIAAADPIALRWPTSIATNDTSNTADRSIINVGELIAAMMNTNRNIPDAYASQAAVTNSIMREAHLTNQLSREFNYAGCPSIEHRSIRPSVHQSIPSIGNIPDMGNSIGHMLNSPLTSSLFNAEVALTVLLHRGNQDAEARLSQLLQSTTPLSNVNMSHLPVSRETLVHSQHSTGNHAIPVTSSLETDQNNLVQLQSLLDSATSSTLLQLSQLSMQGTSIDTLVRILSSGGTVQERYDFSQLTLPHSSVHQQQTRRDSNIESIPNTVTDVAQDVTLNVNDTIIVNNNNNNETDNDDRKLPGNQGGGNQNIVATQPQHNGAVNTSTTSELLTIANNILEIYRSNC